MDDWIIYRDYAVRGSFYKLRQFHKWKCLLLVRICNVFFLNMHICEWELLKSIVSAINLIVVDGSINYII
jgi:hypothetical protein